MYQDLLRVHSDPLSPVLPIVLYHGAERWSAPEEVAGLAAPCGVFLASYQPAQRYFLLDISRYTDSLPAGRNLVAALIRLQRSRSQEDVEPVLDALDEWLSESGYEGLRRAIGEWMRQVYLPGRSTGTEWVAVENWTEARSMLRERVKEWTAQWLEEGRAEGRAELMRRQAVRKFGAVTADRFAEELERVHDSERVAEIGEWLIECESGEEMLDRVRRRCMTPARPDGDDSASS